jgi:hypothetical protein
MALFTKKPIQIEAVQWDGHTLSEVTQWTTEAIESMVLFRVGNEIQVKTLEGVMTASPNDFLIRGVNGEIYPCKPDIFEKSYNASYKESDMDLSVKTTYINSLIKSLLNGETNDISDGYHTFAQLYEHRIILFISLCKILPLNTLFVWRSKLHSDGSNFDGWFVLGMGKEKGKQITYHLPISKWNDCDFAETLEKAPDFDGHTSQDVLTRLQSLI